MTESESTSAGAYLRHPHLHGDLVTFVAEDDIWLAPLDGGRAWRLTADRSPVSHPRFSPDGRSIAWASTRDGAAEIHLAPVDGGEARRLTHWGHTARTLLRGWTPQGEPVAVTSAGQATTRQAWAFAVPLDGGQPRRLPFGPIGHLAFEAAAPTPEATPDAAPDEASGDRVLLLSAYSAEPARWKRYRGGTAGRLWIGTEGGEFTRLHSELDGNIESPSGWATGSPS